MLGPPSSRPLPGLGPRVHELRVADEEKKLTWRIVCRIDPDAILVAHWWAKKTQKTAKKDLDRCRRRLRDYEGRGLGKRG